MEAARRTPSIHPKARREASILACFKEKVGFYHHISLFDYGNLLPSNL